MSGQNSHQEKSCLLDGTHGGMIPELFYKGMGECACDNGAFWELQRWFQNMSAWASAARLCVHFCLAFFYWLLFVSGFLPVSVFLPRLLT